MHCLWLLQLAAAAAAAGDSGGAATASQPAPPHPAESYGLVRNHTAGGPRRRMQLPAGGCPAAVQELHAVCCADDGCPTGAHQPANAARSTLAASSSIAVGLFVQKPVRVCALVPNLRITGGLLPRVRRDARPDHSQMRRPGQGKTLPLPCISTAVVAKTLPFLAAKLDASPGLAAALQPLVELCAHAGVNPTAPLVHDPPSPPKRRSMVRSRCDAARPQNPIWRSGLLFCRSRIASSRLSQSR